MISLTSIIRKRLNRWFNKPESSPWTDYYGDVPEHLQYPSYSMWELIEKTVDKYPRYEAYEYFGKNVTFTKFFQKIEQCAKALKAININKGDRVTICMPNTPEGVIMFYAINMVGATANMIHPLSSVNEIEFYLNKSKSKAILAVDLTYDKVSKAVKNTKVETIITSSVSDSMKRFTHLLYWLTKGIKNKIEIDKQNTICWNAFIYNGKNYEGVYKTSPTADEEAVILYSGGTTGEPKGIVLSNLNFNALAIQSHLMCDPSKAGDSVLGIMPIFHGFGIGVCTHTVLHAGMKCIFIPQFKAKDFYKLIKKYKPNFLAGVPTMYEALVNSNVKDKRYMKCVTTVINGGDTLNPILKDKINKYLESHGSPANVRVGYGLTECTGASCLTPRFFYKDGSIGVPFPDMLYKIVKIGTLNTAKTNKDGEICISGPTVMMHYLDDEQETSKALKKHSDGKIWLHTGDVGCMKKNGMVYFKSRLKRIIVSSGYNIYPQYIEKVINSHPAVETCCVVPMDHPYKMHVPKAYIVLKEGFILNDKLKKDIKKYCEQSIAKYSLPYEYEYRDALPKTLVGKVDFTKLNK